MSNGLNRQLNWVVGWEGADALVQDAENIKMVTVSIQSPSCMEGRELDKELDTIVQYARNIIENVERIRKG